MSRTIFTAFWNLENLFDVENAPRPVKIKNRIKSDIKGWNSTLLNYKLKNLSLVIRSMNDNKGPDILGVSEAENRNVLEKLTNQIKKDGGRLYSIAHADTSDNRGIDVAFLYDAELMQVDKKGIFQHWVVKRSATRELLQVNFDIAKKKLVFICNHWPARSAGQYESEPYRIVAGETLAYWVERIHEELGKNIGIVVTGDFNDDPFNRSLTEYALSTNYKNKVIKGRLKYLFNTMWKIFGRGEGSFYYKGGWNIFDQILINRPLINGESKWKAETEATIEGKEIMGYNKYDCAPRKFGIKPEERDIKGFSDHFPVSIRIKEA